jgi:hypothetical protein
MIGHRSPAASAALQMPAFTVATFTIATFITK